MRTGRVKAPGPARHVFTATLVVAGTGLAVGRADAQSASQITPPAFAQPVRGDLGGGLVVQGGPTMEAPPGAEKLSVRLSGLTVSGGFPELADAEAALRARLTQGRASGAAIFAAAHELEAAYANAGYVLVRVVLPPQRLTDDDPLRLTVIDGQISRIVLSAMPDLLRYRLDTVLEPLCGRKGLRLAELERRLMLAGDTPGVTLRSTLAPGPTTGTTLLVIDASYRPVTGFVTLDNTLALSLGRYQLGLGFDLNNIAGLGEQSYLRATGYPGTGAADVFSDDPRNRQLTAGVILPLSANGLSLNLEGTRSQTAPVPSNGLRSNDVFDRASARLSYAWTRSRSFDVNLSLSFDAQNETQRVGLAGLGVPISSDRLRIVRLGADADGLTPWGAAVSGRIVGSFGINAFGARSAADATALLPLSRQGADDTFQKVNLVLSYGQSFFEGRLAINVTANGQTAFGQALLRSEQIGVAGPLGLSSFDAGTLQGDSGAAARAEISAPTLVQVPGIEGLQLVASPYVFGAAGVLKLNKATALETPVVEAASYGVGLHLGGTATGQPGDGALTVEYGRQARSDAPPDRDRFSLATTIRF